MIIRNNFNILNKNQLKNKGKVVELPDLKIRVTTFKPEVEEQFNIDENSSTLKQSLDEKSKKEPEREDFLGRIQSTKLLIPNFGSLKEKSKASSRRGSVQVIPEDIKEIANSSTKSIAVAK